MNRTNANTTKDASFPSRTLVSAALAVLALLVWTPRVAVGDCWVITSDVTLDEDKTVECVEIARGCFLDLDRYTLTLGGNAATTSTIDGTLVLSQPESKLRIKSNDHTVTGNGNIIGEHNSATIDDHPVFPGDLIIASGFTVRGALKVELDVVNNGTILADDATTQGSRDTLTLNSGAYTGSGVFEVNRWLGTNTAYLEFDATGVTATGMAADFSVSNGTLDIGVNVCTTGDLSFTGGTINVAAGKTFKAGGTCP